MRYALLSDIHGHQQKLAAVLADAQTRGADQIVSVGDVGSDNCLALLLEAGALAVFGGPRRTLVAGGAVQCRRFRPLA